MEREQIFLEKIKIFSSFRMPRFCDLPEIDLYMDQVISVTDKYLGVFSAEGEPVLTPSMINNYVKNRIIPPPEKKKYNREHLARLLIICILKPTMEISAISDMMERREKVNGVQKMFDTFAEMYEKRISTLAREVSNFFKSGEATEELFCSVATENAIKAGAEKIIAVYAYDVVRKKQPEEKQEKPEKKKEKAKEKGSAASEKTE